MRMSKACMMALAMGVPTGGLADDTASVRFTMTVPVKCSADTLAVRSTGTGTALTIEERCNSGRGYALYLDHDPDSITAIRYDGRAVALSEAGRTLLERSPSARNHRARVEIDSTGTTEAFFVIAPEA